MEAIVEIMYIAPRYNRACGCVVPGGYEANCTNPEDFGCSQIYSGLHRTKAEALADIRAQLQHFGATTIRAVKA